MTVCIVCDSETSKYKCPICLAVYCSVPCYEKHKDKPCSPPQLLPSNTPASKEENKRVMPFRTEDTVDLDKLEALEHSEGLKNLLYNAHLRNYLTEVDRAPDAWKAIRAAMQEPLFIEFADECLKVVEPVADDEILF